MAYRVAREKALTKKNIRLVFRGARTYPIDVSKALEVIVASACPLALNPLPSCRTPENQKEGDDEQLWHTPKTS